jgi:DNA-binding transcriptional ArsR family regulator
MSYELAMNTAHDVLFYTLSDPTRRAIFERLVEDGEQTVRVLTGHAGVSQPAVSKHLGILKQAGLVSDRRDGRQTHYSAEPKGLEPVAGWIGHYGAFWFKHIDRLELLVGKMEQ